MWTDSCVSICDDKQPVESRECFWRQTEAGVMAGRRGKGLKRMKFQIPLTVLDSWPGMHTSSGLGSAWGIWNSYLRYVCWPEKKCWRMFTLLQIIDRLH